MPSALDPDLLAQLPPALRAAVEAQVQALALENAELRTRNARLEHLVRELQRARFGPRSEKLQPDQMELAFEDIEFALNNTHAIDFALKHGGFSRHDLQGFV